MSHGELEAEDQSSNNCIAASLPHRLGDYDTYVATKQSNTLKHTKGNNDTVNNEIPNMQTST